MSKFITNKLWVHQFQALVRKLMRFWPLPDLNIIWPSNVHYLTLTILTSITIASWGRTKYQDMARMAGYSRLEWECTYVWIYAKVLKRNCKSRLKLISLLISFIGNLALKCLFFKHYIQIYSIEIAQTILSFSLFDISFQW